MPKAAGSAAPQGEAVPRSRCSPGASPDGSCPKPADPAPGFPRLDAFKWELRSTPLERKLARRFSFAVALGAHVVSTTSTARSLETHGPA